MDPNATLHQLRTQAMHVIAGGGSAVTMAELFQDLDEWLSQGGFIPEAWDRLPSDRI